MPESPVPEALRREIARDLPPVAPLRLLRQALPLAVGASLLLFGWLCWQLGLRWDVERIGTFYAFGLSVAQLALALSFLALSLGEAIPGPRRPTAVLVSAAAAAATAHVVLILITFARSPTMVPEGRFLAQGLFCFCAELALGLPLALLSFVIARRGLVTSPVRLSVSLGVAAGTAGDALWRLFCPFSEPSHPMTAHTGGILALIVGAWILGRLWDQRQRRQWQAQRTADRQRLAAR